MPPRRGDDGADGTSFCFVAALQMLLHLLALQSFEATTMRIVQEFVTIGSFAMVHGRETQ